MKKSNARSEAGKKATGNLRLPFGPQVHWIESDQPLFDLGHGVEFMHDELQREHVVAFLEGFDWLPGRRGGPATVRIRKTGPPSISAHHWEEIIKSTREAVLVFLSKKHVNLDSFRHGPIHIISNC